MLEGTLTEAGKRRLSTNTTIGGHFAKSIERVQRIDCEVIVALVSVSNTQSEQAQRAQLNEKEGWKVSDGESERASKRRDWFSLGGSVLLSGPRAQVLECSTQLDQGR